MIPVHTKVRAARDYIDQVLEQLDEEPSLAAIADLLQALQQIEDYTTKKEFRSNSTLKLVGGMTLAWHFVGFRNRLVGRTVRIRKCANELKAPTSKGPSEVPGVPADSQTMGL